MSLDIYLYRRVCYLDTGEEESMQVHGQNITHNLGRMWREAGVYEALYESEGKKAADILPVLENGLEAMRTDPPRFEQHNAPNGWGMYKHAVPWLESLIEACKQFPGAEIEVSR